MSASIWPEFKVGDVYEFAGARPRKNWGQWTVTRVEGNRVYATGEEVAKQSIGRDACMVDMTYSLADKEYTPVLVAEEPCEPEDWS